MKVIIPVAGAGTKLRPHTYTQPKPLIPLAGKTILSFIIDQFIDNKIMDFIFVIGYMGEKIIDYVKQKYPHINSTFVIQKERGGTGHAIYLTKDFIDENEEIIIVYGDTICDYNLSQLLQSTHSLIGVRKVDDPRHFGVAELNADGTVKTVVEKPIIPKSNLALVGIYKFMNTQLLFEILTQDLAKVKSNEEYPLTIAIDSMLKQKSKIEIFHVNHWFDCGRKETLLETNATLLNKMEFASEEIPFFDNTIIIHPVSIALGCTIENSIIGPNVTIGEHTKIKSSIISDSIIGSFSEIEKVVLHSSLIGGDAIIKGTSQSLNIGDNTEIDLS